MGSLPTGRSTPGTRRGGSDIALLAGVFPVGHGSDSPPGVLGPRRPGLRQRGQVGARHLDLRIRGDPRGCDQEWPANEAIRTIRWLETPFAEPLEPGPRTGCRPTRCCRFYKPVSEFASLFSTPSAQSAILKALECGPRVAWCSGDVRTTPFQARRQRGHNSEIAS